MRVVHVADDETVLASDVDVAEGFVETSKGLMFRSSIPDEYALVFEFEAPDGFVPSLLDRLPFYENSAVARRLIHMLFVRFPIDVLWLDGEEVVHVKTLRPWIGIGMGHADRIIEFPEGAADGVEVGDRVVVREDDPDGTEADES